MWNPHFQKDRRMFDTSNPHLTDISPKRYFPTIRTFNLWNNTQTN